MPMESQREGQPQAKAKRGRPTDFGQSRLYGALEVRFPALLGATLQALAVK